MKFTYQPFIPKWRKKVIVAGSRKFTDYQLLKKKLEKYTENFDDLVVITGACPTGADALAEKWASSKMLTIFRFHAEWEKHGLRAGPVRNSEMADFAGKEGYLVAFWDGKSDGTGDIIRKCRKKGMKIRIVRF